MVPSSSEGLGRREDAAARERDDLLRPGFALVPERLDARPRSRSSRSHASGRGSTTGCRAGRTQTDGVRRRLGGLPSLRQRAYTMESLGIAH